MSATSHSPRDSSTAGPVDAERHLHDAHDLDRPVLVSALRDSVLARTNGDWTRAERSTRHTATFPVHAGRPASLYRGAPALGFVLHTAGRPAHRSARAHLDHAVDGLIRTRLAAAWRRIDTGGLPRRSEYDLINGLTGLGALLLTRPRPHDLLHDIQTYLIRLLDEQLTIDGTAVPGWWSTDPLHHPVPGRPGGHADFGLAHGVSGPIALLALGARAGHDVPGQRDCLRRASALLCARRRPLGPAPPLAPTTAGTETCPAAHHERRTHAPHGWPAIADAQGWHDPPDTEPPLRPSWCYGTPGIARALQLAAIATGDETTRRTAEDTLADCLTDPAQLALLDDPTVCHGRAGLHLTAVLAAADAHPHSRLAELPAPIHTLIGGDHGAGHCASLGHTTDEHPARRSPRDDPDRRALSPNQNPETGGLLTGNIGVELVHHTVSSLADHPNRPRWETCLLLR